MENISVNSSKRPVKERKTPWPIYLLGMTVLLVSPTELSAGPAELGHALPTTSSIVAPNDLFLVHCCHNHPYAPNDRYCCHDGRTVGRAIVGGAVAYGTYKGVKKVYKKHKRKR